MIWMTGDTHSNFHRFSSKRFPQQKQMTRDDYVIILGDFGGVWDDSAEEHYWLDWLNNKSFTTLWIDGNHENFDLLEQYPLVEFQGGLAHQIRPHLFHLCRGEIFQLDGKKFLVLGGAQSHDSSIIFPRDSKIRPLSTGFPRQQIPSFRVEGLNWWSQELPSQSELQAIQTRLEQIHWPDDLFVLSHCAPTDLQLCLFPDYPYNILTDFLMLLRHHLSYRWWYCGHYHQNITLHNQRFSVLYEEIIPFNQERRR